LFLLQHANQHEFIKGVVGWIDLRAENIQDWIDHFSSYKKLKGFRHIVQGEPDDQFLLGKDFCFGIAALHNKGFTYDILIYPKQLEAAIEFVKRFPDQLFVVDHIAKPLIKEGRLDNWEKFMRELSTFDNVYCKISGMATEADWKIWRYNDFTPYLDVALDSFGSKRIMYGSDWPVCLVAASYQQQLNIVEQYIARLSAGEQKDIMGENAIRFYNL